MSKEPDQQPKAKKSERIKNRKKQQESEEKEKYNLRKVDAAAKQGIIKIMKMES